MYKKQINEYFIVIEDLGKTEMKVKTRDGEKTTKYVTLMKKITNEETIKMDLKRIFI